MVESVVGLDEGKNGNDRHYEGDGCDDAQVIDALPLHMIEDALPEDEEEYHAYKQESRRPGIDVQPQEKP